MNVLSGLGIDLWALLIYVVNFGVIVLILRKFVYRPLLSFLDKRRELISQNISEAEELKKKFSAELIAKENETKALLTRMRQEIAQVKEQAEHRAEDMIREVQQERSRLLRETDQEIVALKADVYRQIETEIKQRIEKMLLTILGKNVPQEVVKKSISEAWESITP